MSGGLGLGGSPGLDRDFVTGSIPVPPALLSDDDIIKAAVAGANLKNGNLQNIPWTNEVTGNTGIISYVRERRNVSEICRKFVASKHNYDGISQYNGKICRTRMGQSWALQSIEEQG